MPFAEMAERLAASRLGVVATWISRDGGPSVTLRVIPARPEGAYGPGQGPRASAPVTSVRIAASALSAKPAADDLIAFEGAGYRVVGAPEADARGASWLVHLRVA